MEGTDPSPSAFGKGIRLQTGFLLPGLDRQRALSTTADMPRLTVPLAGANKLPADFQCLLQDFLPVLKAVCELECSGHSDLLRISRQQVSCEIFVDSSILDDLKAIKSSGIGKPFAFRL